MRFKSVLFAFSALVLAVVNASAEDASSAFEENKEEILEEGLRKAGGFRFGVGIGLPVTESTSALKAAQEKSELLATGDLVRSVAFSELEWPGCISEKAQQNLSEYYRFSVSATLSGIRKIYQQREGFGWVTVVTVPERQTVSIGKVTFSELRKQLLTPRSIFSPKAPDEAIIELILSQQDFSPIDRTPWEKNLQGAKFDNFYLQKLQIFAGRCIVKLDSGNWSSHYEKGMKAYRNGALKEAYEFFVAAAEKSWNFDVMNMAGNVARRIGKDDEAVAFLLYAASLAPEKPFPWVHLAFVAKKQGDMELCEACCKEANSRKPDKWTLEQVAVLRKRDSKDEPSKKNSSEEDSQ